jgi:hypothetical protein
MHQRGLDKANLALQQLLSIEATEAELAAKPRCART